MATTVDNSKELQKLSDTIKELSKVIAKTNSLIDRQNTKTDALTSSILELKSTIKGNPSE